jgi:hypothetical protein
VGFEPAIPASERPQSNALDRASTGTGGHQFQHLDENFIGGNLKEKDMSKDNAKMGK